MKLVTYERAGAVRHGYLDPLDGSGVVELGDGDLQPLLEANWAAHASATTLARTLVEPTAAHGHVHPLADISLRAPLLRPGKLLAAAANYQEHVTETGAAPLERARLSPRLFLKPSTSIVGPDAPIRLPAVSDQVDWEAELAVVIGARCADVPVDDALSTVAGYLVANDVSARRLDLGYERDTEDKAAWFFDWLAGKWADTFAPLGPWLVTADEIPDPQALTIALDLNGEPRQRGSTAQMIFSVAELIAHASRLCTLEPGDILLTGTPSGVGAARSEYLRPGDVLTVTIDGLGGLRNPVT